jgi:hypothetical protein
VSDIHTCIFTVCMSDTYRASHENEMVDFSKYQRFGIIIALIFLYGCTDQGYKHAFSDQSAINGNSKYFICPTDRTNKSVKQTPVKQAFTIDATGSSGDSIKPLAIFHRLNRGGGGQISIFSY